MSLYQLNDWLEKIKRGYHNHKGMMLEHPVSVKFHEAWFARFSLPTKQVLNSIYNVKIDKYNIRWRQFLAKNVNEGNVYELEEFVDAGIAPMMPETSFAAVKANIMIDQKRVGKLARVFYIHQNGLPSVEHAGFNIDLQYQKHGIARELNHYYEDIYRKMGIKQITSGADGTIGRYAWALQGFDFEPREGLNDYQRDFSSAIDRLKGISIEKREEYKAQVFKFKHSWDFAKWNPDNKPYGEHLGKKLMLEGKEWNCKKSLEKDSIDYKVGELYYQTSKNREKKSNV